MRYYALGLFIHSGMFFPGILISTRFLLNTDAYQLYQRPCLSLCSHPIPICIIIMLVWISLVPYMYFLSLSTVIVSCSFFVAIITHLIMSSPNIVIITAMMLRPSLSIFPQLQTASPFLVVVVLPRSVPSPTVFIFMVFLCLILPHLVHCNISPFVYHVHHQLSQHQAIVRPIYPFFLFLFFSTHTRSFISLSPTPSTLSLFFPPYLLAVHVSHCSFVFIHSFIPSNFLIAHCMFCII